MKSFWRLFPDSNLRTSKRRPALIVQGDGLTADLRQTGHPSRAMAPMDSPAAEGSGLLMDSVIMTDNLATIHNSEIDRAIGLSAR
jgi:mRNA interferase MazF